MKKLLVLVVAVLALAGLATLAYADTDIFKESWLHPMSQWMGPDTNIYAADGRLHAINTQMATGPTGPFSDPVIVDPSASTNNVAEITYQKLVETFSGRNCQVFGSPTSTLNLSGSSKVSFRARRGATMTANVVVLDFHMTDTNGVSVSSTTVQNVSLGATWTNYEIPVTGRNLSGVNKPFGFFINNAQAAANGNNVVFLLDDIKYVTENSGIVTVTMTAGVVGAKVDQIVNFDRLAPINPNATYNSADIITAGYPLEGNFLVTNIGTSAAIFGLNLVNPSGWTSAAPAQNLSSGVALGVNTFALYGIFNNTGPANTDYQGTSSPGNDVITTTLRDSATGTYFSNGGNDGYNVAGGGTRNLWIGLRTPSSTTVTSTQQIIVVVTASAL